MSVQELEDALQIDALKIPSWLTTVTQCTLHFFNRVAHSEFWALESFVTLPLGSKAMCRVFLSSLTIEERTSISFIYKICFVVVLDDHRRRGKRLDFPEWLACIRVVLWSSDMHQALQKISKHFLLQDRTSKGRSPRQ